MNILRLKEFFTAADHHSILVDASAGLILGALPGLEDFEAALRPLLPLADGVVCAPGQIRRLQGNTLHDAGLLMRMDWTNSLRGPDFVLPPAQIHQIPLFGAREASDFGAVGMVLSFLLGYEEEIEAVSMKATVALALEGKAAGMPLIVEVRPNGPRVLLAGKAVELGASYALEGGADGIAIPHPGSASLKSISQFVSVPWLLKPSSFSKVEQELDEALSLGGAGLWLDHTLFQQPAPAQVLRSLSRRIHAVQPVE
jgi:DhnA family fructose-bisphosphate aldolase class Ia